MKWQLAAALGGSALLHGALLVGVAARSRPVEAAPAPASGAMRLLSVAVIGGRLGASVVPSAKVAAAAPSPARLERSAAGAKSRGGQRAPDLASPLRAIDDKGEEQGGGVDTPADVSAGAALSSTLAGANEGTGAPGVAGSNAELAALHRRLSEAARTCYPASARRYALRGTVKLAFVLDAAGAELSRNLEGSTGSSALDQAALDCVLPRAAPLPRIPGRFVVEVRFGDL